MCKSSSPLFTNKSDGQEMINPRSWKSRSLNVAKVFRRAQAVVNEGQAMTASLPDALSLCHYGASKSSLSMRLGGSIARNVG
jgi:hypothetical protein